VMRASAVVVGGPTPASGRPTRLTPETITWHDRRVPPSAGAGKLPFWIHQLVEYTVAILIASEGARSGKPLVPMVGAVVVLVNAAIADGPGAAFRWVPRKVHRVLDLVVATGLVLAGIVLRSQAGSVGQVILIGGGALLGALVLRSNYEPKPVKVRRSRTRPNVASPTPTPASGASAAPRATNPTTATAPSVTAPSVTAPSASAAPAPTPAPPVPSTPTAPSSSEIEEPATLAMVEELLRRPSGPSSSGGRGPGPADAPPTPTPKPKPKPVSRGAKAEQAGRVAGRAVGKGVNAWRTRKR
jgi:hypothetical protein